MRHTGCKTLGRERQRYHYWYKMRVLLRWRSKACWYAAAVSGRGTTTCGHMCFISMQYDELIDTTQLSLAF